nr:hypothetical protein [Actinopolymorpha singaporensis]
MDLFEAGQAFLGLGEHGDDRRFMRDEGAYPLRVPRDEVEADDRAAAASEDVRRDRLELVRLGSAVLAGVADRVQDGQRVGCLLLDAGLARWAGDGAAGVATPVVRHDPVGVGERRCERTEDAGVAEAARDQQQERFGGALGVV